MMWHVVHNMNGSCMNVLIHYGWYGNPFLSLTLMQRIENYADKINWNKKCILISTYISLLYYEVSCVGETSIAILLGKGTEMLGRIFVIWRDWGCNYWFASKKMLFTLYWSARATWFQQCSFCDLMICIYTFDINWTTKEQLICLWEDSIHLKPSTSVHPVLELLALVTEY